MNQKQTASEHPRMLALGWPLFVELLLGMAAGWVGTVLAARESDLAGAAFALSNHVLGILFIFLRIIGAGVSVVITQNLGGGHRDQAQAVALATLAASTWLGLATGLGTWAGSDVFLAWMNAPAAVAELARPLLLALAPVLLVDAWLAILSSVLRAHLRSRDTLWVLVAMQCLHLPLAWALMRGAGPIPALGLVGFAWALLASKLLGLGLFLWLWRMRLQLRPRLADWLQLRRRELAAVLHIGLPGAAENIAYRLAFVVSVAVAGHLGAQALATQAYVQQLGYFCLLFGLAAGFTAEIIVGHLIGAGALHEAHQLVRRTLARGLVISVFITTLVALAGPQLLGLFTSDANLIAVGVTLLWWGVVLEPGRTFNLVVINALRATGDARYPVVVGAGSMVVVLAGGSWLLGEKLGLGLVGIWIAYAADEWLRGLLMWRRWARQDWVPHARAARRRMRQNAVG
jgi:Na+-driven multidrug efflux pump